MALGPDHFNVTVSLSPLFCYFGADTGGIFQDASEPYMWVLMFKIDGETLSQNGNGLQGTPSYFFSPGSHGNLADEVYPGQNVHVPPQIGTWETSLQPIPLGLPGSPVAEVPGLIGCFVVLLEWNETPDSAMEAGHQEVNSLVQSTLNDIVASIGLAGLAADAVAEVATAASKGKVLAIGDAVQIVLNRRLKPVLDLFASTAAGATEATIINNLGLDGFIGSVIGRDQVMGVGMQLFTQKDLAKTSDDSHAPISMAFDDNPRQPESGRWAYTLHGSAWAHIQYKPIPEGIVPDASRLRVACVTKAYSQTRGRWISHVGGTQDGTSWRIARANAIDLIQRGQKSFFVHAEDGAQAEVLVADSPQVGHTYLATRPDGRPEDNLVNLPACPMYAVNYY
jgi:hypothetical protein